MTDIKQSSIITRKILIGLLVTICALSAIANPAYAKGKKSKSAHRTHIVAKNAHKNKSLKKISKSKKVKATKKVVALNNSTKLVANIPINIEGPYEHHEVNKFVKQFNQSKGTLIKTTQSSPHMDYIVEQVEKRNMPKELAFLPVLESNFKQNAISYKGAVGLWQFMPATGKQYGLKQNAGLDERRDVKASTKAALTYLDYLHKKFDRDWMLALAAYNAGEGTVDRAIKRNKKAGKPTSFWSLKLPKQTKEYVPKFFAIIKIMKQSNQ